MAFLSRAKNEHNKIYKTWPMRAARRELDVIY
jgi:hypothetical protein